ncbi:Protein of uncharacterised function (DUF2971) [Serratia quinivorans]|uniref:DUF2971 domain-containing protein n=1 Tax=Serratia quinivorans TaxID=137545 RepID=UPI00217780B4|nr:DUF2971 domain-containing protein [Serratia quinivorans]CAI0902617.1 Protein of uncharacterised function (DUF2971) [Serratia quinivorans]
MALIYHYCSPNTFQQIIEHSSLWLSSTRNMNDFAEGQLLRDAVSKVLQRNQMAFGDKWCNQVWDLFLQDLKSRYITCMSEKGDILSQWRAYAQDGEGVAIGFDEEALGIRNNTIPTYDIDPVKSLTLIKVNYKDFDSLEKEIEEYAITFRDASQTLEESAGLFSIYCAGLEFTIKNPAFSEEREKRIIYTPVKIPKELKLMKRHSSMSEVKFRTAGPYLVSYYAWKFSKEKCIHEIVLGPKNKFSNFDLEIFLEANDLTHIKVTKSAATYR